MLYNQIAGIAAGYLVIGAMVWMQIAFENRMERKIKQQNKYVPIRFLKTVVFWLPYLLIKEPNSSWMCK